MPGRGGDRARLALLAGLALLTGAALWLWPAPSVRSWIWPAPPAGNRPIPPWDAAARPDPLRITAFGSSLTHRPDWPDRLAARLERCLGTTRRVEIARVSAGGAGSAWGQAQVAAVIATRPDLVLIEFAINDADLRNGISLERSRDQHRRSCATCAPGCPGHGWR